MRGERVAICDYDCFHCVYNDCINDELTLADYQAEKRLDDLAGCAGQSRHRREICKRSYQKNREKRLTYAREYAAENREKRLAYQRGYQKENRGRINARNRANRRKKREKEEQHESG